MPDPARLRGDALAAISGARQLLYRNNGRTLGTFARDINQRDVKILSKDAVTFCLVGALRRHSFDPQPGQCCPVDIAEVTETLVYEALKTSHLYVPEFPTEPMVGLAMFNDMEYTTNGSVVWVLDHAIAHFSLLWRLTASIVLSGQSGYVRDAVMPTLR